MAKPYPLWTVLPVQAAHRLCEEKEEFLGQFERVLTLFDENPEAWKKWVSYLKDPERRQFIMKARYFARGEVHRVPEYVPAEQSGQCREIPMSYVRLELPRHVIGLMRKAGMRVEGQIYHALGMDDDSDHERAPHGHEPGAKPDGARFPTEKLPNVLRFHLYMYMHGELPQG